MIRLALKLPLRSTESRRTGLSVNRLRVARLCPAWAIRYWQSATVLPCLVMSQGAEPAGIRSHNHKQAYE